MFSTFQCSTSFHYGVSSKAVLSIFKEVKHIESVTMKIEESDVEYNLIFELFCRHGVRKIFHIRLFDSVLNSVRFNKEHAPNTISIRPDLLCKAIQYLQTSDETIMKVQESTFSLENIPAVGEVRTVSNMNVSDVDEIMIQAPTSLRFLIGGFLSVLQLFIAAEIPLLLMEFGEGGNIMRISAKPGCDRAGMAIEYLLTTASEEEEISSERVIDGTMARQPEFEEKRVEVQREEQSDEELPIRMDEEDEWM